MNSYQQVAAFASQSATHLDHWGRFRWVGDVGGGSVGIWLFQQSHLRAYTVSFEFLWMFAGKGRQRVDPPALAGVVCRYITKVINQIQQVTLQQVHPDDDADGGAPLFCRCWWVYGSIKVAVGSFALCETSSSKELWNCTWAMNMNLKLTANDQPWTQSHRGKLNFYSGH